MYLSYMMTDTPYTVDLRAYKVIPHAMLSVHTVNSNKIRVLHVNQGVGTGYA